MKFEPEKSADENSHLTIYRDMVSECDITTDKDVITDYIFKEINFENEDDFLELELEINE